MPPHYGVPGKPRKAWEHIGILREPTEIFGRLCNTMRNHGRHIPYPNFTRFGIGTPGYTRTISPLRIAGETKETEVSFGIPRKPQDNFGRFWNTMRNDGGHNDTHCILSVSYPY